MARKKHATAKQPLKSRLKPPLDQLVPEELRDAEDVTIRAITTNGESVSAVTFALEFPAVLTARVRTEKGGGYSASVPALPGCITEADTLEELRQNLQEAAQGWLQTMTEMAEDDPLGSALNAGGR